MNLEHFSFRYSIAVGLITLGLLFESCDHAAHLTSSREIDMESYNLGSVGAFSEMINAGVKGRVIQYRLSREPHEK